MIIEIGQLSQTEKRFTGEEQASVLALEYDPFFEVKGPIKYDLRACLVYFELVIRGMLEVELSCHGNPFFNPTSNHKFTGK